MYRVYLITNKVNGKQYVGITKQPIKRRFQDHIRGAENGKKRILSNAIRKYGKENFKLELLEDNVEDSKASEKEQYYIEQYQSHYKNGGYNMTIGGNGTVGYEFTEEDRRKISEAGKGRQFSKERNNKIRNAMIGREYKDEWKESLSKSRVGRFGGENNPFYGKEHSEESKQKIRISKHTRLVERIDIQTDKVLEVYDSGIFAAQWVIDNNISKAHPNTIRCQIGKACNGTYEIKTCYGFKWKFKERSID